MTPHPPAGADDQTDARDDIEFPELGFETVPVLAQRASEAGEGVAEGVRPEESVHREADGGHARQSRRQGDEGAHHGHKAAEEDDGAAVAAEQPLGESEIVTRDQDVPAVPQDEGTPSPSRYRVGGPRSRDAAGGPPESRTMQAEFPAKREVSRKRHDDLGRERDGGALDGHHQKNAEVPQ